MPTRTNRRAAAGGRSRLGQNFLVDYRIAKRIVATARITDSDEVLEIGPGKGALTRILVQSAPRLLAVELDADLANSLACRFAGHANFEIVNMDALDFNPADYFESRYKVVANLPYYAATPIIRKFITAEPRPESMIVMVQKEVAASIAAAPGQMSLLSVMTQLYGEPKILFSAPPRAFKPMPKVRSAVIRIDPYDRPAVDIDSPDSFIEFVAAGFRAPRKQILNSLRLGLGACSDSTRLALDLAGIDVRRRPATLSLTEWAELYRAWRGGSHLQRLRKVARRPQGMPLR